MSTVRMDGWASRNMWPLPDGTPAVRPGLRKTSSTFQRTVAGFSLVEPYTGIGWHYWVSVDASTSDNCIITVIDENNVVMQTYDTGSDVVPEVVTFGVVLDFLVISSPSFPTAFGFVGGGLIKALKVASTNTATTAIDVPQGLCVRWVDRIVYAAGSTLFFSDPVGVTGGDPRTVVAENQLGLEKTVHGLHVNAGGALVVVTEGGTFALSEQASAAGQVVLGDMQRLTDYSATRAGQTISSHGRVFGLTQKGFRLVDSVGAEEIEIDDPHMPVGNGERIQCDDYRKHCSIYATERGPAISYPRQVAVHMVDQASGSHSWWTMTDVTANADGVVGVMREPDGTDFLLTGIGMYAISGNSDGTTGLSDNAAVVKGFFMGRQPSPVEGSPVVRRVDVASDTGSNILAGVRGLAKTATTTQRGAVIGTAVWGTDLAEEPPLQSARFHYADRTDDIALEAGAETPLARVDPSVSLKIRGPGKRGRP